MKKLDFTVATIDGKLPEAHRLQLKAYLAANNGKLLRWQVGKPDGKASDPQRRYWFAVVCEYVAEHCGYTKEEAHDLLLWELMPELRKTLKRFDGSETARRVSWTELTREQTTVLVDRAFQFCAEKLGLFIPSPREYGVT